MKFQPKDYCYYSRLLKKEFDTLDELRAAEAEELKKQEAKAQAAENKKNDASIVERAYKELNAAKKRFKDDLNQINARYAEDLKTLKEKYDTDRQEVLTAFERAETTYENALKEFTNKYPEGFHITLKDGDYETTLARQVANANCKFNKPVDDTPKTLFELLFGL